MSEDKADRNEHVPDITIIPAREGVVTICSKAMRCEYAVKADDLVKEIPRLIDEYREAVSAGSVAAPDYLRRFWRICR